MQDHAAGLFVQMAIDQTCAFNGERDDIVACPSDDVRNQPRVIRQMLAGVAAIDIGGHVCHARLSVL